MTVNIQEIVYAAIGFLLCGVMTPIGLGRIYAGSTWGNTTAINLNVITLFQILFPIMYLVGLGLYFIPKVGKGD